MSELSDDVAKAIYEEGKASRRQGVGLDECPYDGSHAFVMWRSGWRSEDAYIGIPKNRRETAATPTPDAPKPPIGVTEYGVDFGRVKFHTGNRLAIGAMSMKEAQKVAEPASPPSDVDDDDPPLFWGVIKGPAPAPKPRRVPVQIAVTPETDGSYGAIVALANDGSMWEFVEKADNDKWERLPDLPQDE